MAFVCKHVSRGLGKSYSAALLSLLDLQNYLSKFSTFSDARTGENSCVDLSWTGEFLRGCASESSKCFLAATNDSEVKGVSGQRYITLCNSALERNVESFRPESKRSNVKFQTYGVSLDCLSRSSRPGKSCGNPIPSARALSTAVSTDDKLRHDGDDEELLSKADEEDGGGVGNGGLVERDAKDSEAEPSIYSSATNPSQFTTADINKYFNVSSEVRERYLGEGFPAGLMKEFADTSENAFLVRERMLHLFERFQKSLADILRFNEQKEKGDPVRFFASKPRQCLLEGFVKGGKSAALAMLVLWARMQGWLVFYVPNGREWTSGGMYLKNSQTGLFDTPIQAKDALEGFLKSHSTILESLPCRIPEPLYLTEGAGTARVRGSQEFTLPPGAALSTLVEKGISQSQAAVSCLLRLREELNMVKDVPVLIAIDEFNSWFTYSSYHESTGTRSRRPVHSRELSMVHAFRTMEGPLMMATAFSQSLAVGKLPVHLPGVPKGARFLVPRYTLDETRAALKYYHSRKIVHREPWEEDIKKLFYLTNGNGDELRTLVRLL